jgi:hypothetical protein
MVAWIGRLIIVLGTSMVLCLRVRRWRGSGSVDLDVSNGVALYMITVETMTGRWKQDWERG